ncbi:MAG: molybdopterin molybdenumtransferase MoeA [Frankiales bacterium]|nr:molybdopterin molybdenumtransferase MoeA [Frankiales bacterium]
MSAATSWSVARRAAREAASALPVVEVPLPDAVGSVLAHPLVAATALPPFDSASMDGWAVSGPGPWTVVGRLLAGDRLDSVADGTALVVSTGAALPIGVDAVLRRERGLTRESAHGTELVVGDPVRGLPAPHPGYVEPGSDIRPRGGECAAGDALLEAGGVVTPAVVGMAAAAGYDALHVVRPPDVALLVLGDELLERGPSRDGRVRDALGPMLPGWVAWTGGRAFPPVRVPDSLDALLEELEDANADVVITTGSTAAGPADHLHAALRRLGAHWVVDGVSVRPGSPMCLARLPDGRFVIGLPGNPLAAVSALLTLAVPLVAALRGEVGADETQVGTAVLAADVRPHPTDVRLIPVVRRHVEGEDVATPTLHDGPAMLRGLTLADGMAVVPAGDGARGSTVQVLPLP